MTLVIRVSKADEERRWFTCVAMVADERDAHGDMFTAETVELCADDFIKNLATKKLGIQHTDFTRDLAIVGHWFTPEGALIDGLTVQPNSWIVRFKVYDDDVWKRIKNNEFTGVSIAGTFRVKAKS